MTNLNTAQMLRQLADDSQVIGEILGWVSEEEAVNAGYKVAGDEFGLVDLDSISRSLMSREVFDSGHGVMIRIFDDGSALAHHFGGFFIHPVEPTGRLDMSECDSE